MIIVTGGAGFIGSNLVAGLQKQKNKHDIVVCDNFGTGEKWKNLVKRELRDVVAPERLFDYLKKHSDRIEAVFHLGAVSSTTETDVDMILDYNFVLSRRLWKFCGTHDIPFFYASSAATYGNGSQGFSDDDSIEALERLRPLNPYGWSKHLFDRRVARVRDEGTEKCPPQWAGFKFFNVYGPNEYHKGEQKSVACKLYPQVYAGAAAKLFKSSNPEFDDGGQRRDFIYVKDCVDVMLWFLDNPEVSGIFNVGTGKARTFNALAKAVFAACDKPAKITYIDMPQQLDQKYQYFTEANTTKLRSIGYPNDFTELEDGVKDYVENYMSKEDQYE